MRRPRAATFYHCRCPRCGQKVRYRANRAGRPGICPRCRQGLPLPATPLENGSIEGSIVDAQGLLNVNNLAPADSSITADAERARFARLFARVGVPPASLDAIADWIDADSVVRPTGAEDAWYAQQPSPMLAANAPVVL